MKVFWLTALSVISFSAIAQSSGRDIYDLMYLPKAGTIYGQSAAAYGRGEAKFYDEDAGSTLGEYTRNVFAVNQVVGYSLMDNLSLQASIGYQMEKAEFDQDGGDTDDFDSSGVKDPEVSLRYRVMDGDLLFDVLVRGLVSIGDSKSPTADKDGNSLEGGHQAGVGLQVGQDKGAEQWAARFSYNRIFEAIDKTDGTTTDSNAHNEFELELEGLFGIAQDLYFVPSAEWIIEEKFNDDQGGKTSQLSTINLRGELRYVLNKDLMLSGSITYTNLENSVQDRQEYREDWFFAGIVSATYQF